MRPTRLLTATMAAFLLVCGIPAAAIAETDVVLSNESEGTEVTTGDSSFTNNENTSSSSASFDASSNSESITATQTAGDAATGAATNGQVSGTVPSAAAPASSSGGAGEGVGAASSESVDPLFVGFSVGTETVSP